MIRSQINSYLVIDSLDESEFGPIDKIKDPEKDIRAEPYPLPKGYEWCSCDVNNDEEVFIYFLFDFIDIDPNNCLIIQIKEIYDLLYMNYVEDDDAMFRFKYGIPFLRW